MDELNSIVIKQKTFKIRTTNVSRDEKKISREFSLKKNLFFIHRMDDISNIRQRQFICFDVFKTEYGYR